MTIVAAVLLGALVLTLVFGYRYIDNMRIESDSDVYEKGWTNGYDVGVKSCEYSNVQIEEKYNEGWSEGWDDAAEYFKKKSVKKTEKKPVKKAKKITHEEN